MFNIPTSPARQTSAVHSLAGLALAIMLAACGSGSSAAINAPAATGSEAIFALHTVNGAGLPYQISDAPTGSTEILEGGLILRPDYTYSARIVVRKLPTGTVDSSSASGTYVVTPTGVELTATGGASASYRALDGGATLDGPSLPSSGPTVAILREFVFKR